MPKQNSARAKLLSFRSGGDNPVSRAVREWYESEPSGSRSAKIREAVYRQYIATDLIDELAAIRREMAGQRDELARLQTGQPPVETEKSPGGSSISGKAFVDGFNFG